MLTAIGKLATEHSQATKMTMSKLAGAIIKLLRIAS
jgi:hypothetical protein